MNKSAFLHLIQNASSISAQEAEELEELVVNFPYCQTAHLLIAKSAYDRGSMLSNQKLRRAASYATNRQLLKKLIYTTSPDVTLKEVNVPEIPEEAKVPAQADETPFPVAETPRIALQPEHPAEEQQETISLEPEFFQDAAPSPAEEAVEEPVIGEIEFEASELSNWSPALKEPPTESEPLVGNADQITGQEPALEAEPLFYAYPPTPSPDNTPAPAADLEAGEEEDEDLQDELAGLLYIDRIMPYRHLLPEHVDTFPEEEETEPIPLAQFANPSLTEEEVTALKELIKPEEEPEDEAEGAEDETPAKAEIGKEEGAPEAPSAAEPVETSELGEYVREEKEPDLVGEETLSRFDAFLFHPERDSVEQSQMPQEVEETTATYPADVIDRIYAQNQLGYWMNSSRLGESLEVKNELTTPYPFHFHPELILEYMQVNEVEKQVKSVESPSDHQLDLIDQFLKMNRRLKQFGDAKVRTEPQEDLSFKSSKIKKSFASENLANIFIKQGKIMKAIKIYEHLIVKIPEKKAYFAVQIEKLRNIT